MDRSSDLEPIYDTDFEWLESLNSSLTDNESIPLYGPPLHDGSVLIWFTGLYLTIFIIGCIGNALTVIVVKKTRDLQSNTYLFLCNLAFSDVILLVSGIPFDLAYIWRTYPAIAGSWHCILKAQLSEMASNVSIMTILLLACERFVAICRPLHLCVYFSRERVIKYVTAVWIVAAISALCLSAQFAVVPYREPNSSRVYEEVTQCDVEPSRSIPYIFEINSILFFVLPMALIFVAYGAIIRELNHCPAISSTKKITTVVAMASNSSSTSTNGGPQSKARFMIIIMLIIVASVFFVCFLPLHIQRLMTTYDKERMGASYENAHFSQVWFTVAGLMHFISAAVNPIIYNAFSRRFRSACKYLLCTPCIAATTTNTRPLGRVIRNDTDPRPEIRTPMTLAHFRRGDDYKISFNKYSSARHLLWRVTYSQNYARASNAGRQRIQEQKNNAQWL